MRNPSLGAAGIRMRQVWEYEREISSEGAVIE
jgi:hypothetical protein